MFFHPPSLNQRSPTNQLLVLVGRGRTPSFHLKHLMVVTIWGHGPGRWFYQGMPFHHPSRTQRSDRLVSCKNEALRWVVRWGVPLGRMFMREISCKRWGLLIGKRLRGSLPPKIPTTISTTPSPPPKQNTKNRRERMLLFPSTKEKQEAMATGSNPTKRGAQSIDQVSIGIWVESLSTTAQFLPFYHPKQ